MITNIKHILRIVILLFCVQKGYAQQFPVQANFFLKAPYPVYLADYANPAGNQIVLQLLLKDQSFSGINVKLRFSIEGAGISYANLPNLPASPEFTLLPNIPLRIQQADIAYFFKAENLIISPNQYAKALPEGIYKFTVQVIDALTNRVVSKVEQSPPIWIVVNDPPILNTPINQSSIKIIEPQNLLFQWTPRHKQANSVEYEFTLTELLVPKNFTGNLQNMFLSQPAYYQSTTTNTTLLYGPALPPLIAGRVYGFRVKAKAKQGLEEVGLFRNEGYSEVFVFRYGEENTPPKLISAAWGTDGLIQLNWEGASAHGGFEIKMKTGNVNENIPNIDLQNPGKLTQMGNGRYGLKLPANFGKVSTFKIGGISKIESDGVLYSNELSVPVYDFSKASVAPLTKDEADYVGNFTGKSTKKNPKAAVATCDNPRIVVENQVANEIAKGDVLYAGGNKVSVVDESTASAELKIDNMPVNIQLYFSKDFKINQFNEIISGYLSSEPTNEKIVLLSAAGGSGVLAGNVKQLGLEIDGLRKQANNEIDALIALSLKANGDKKKENALASFEKYKSNLSEMTKLIETLQTEISKNIESSEAKPDDVKQGNTMKEFLKKSQQDITRNETNLSIFKKTYSTIDSNLFGPLLVKLLTIK